jgi:hypothetical protein
MEVPLLIAASPDCQLVTINMGPQLLYRKLP